MVYSNQLIYTPMQNSFSIVRTSTASIPIECRFKRYERYLYGYNHLYLFISAVFLLYICHNVYPRTHFVSSIDVKPSWPTTSALELIGFSFHLMNGMFRIKLKSVFFLFLFLFIYFPPFFFLDDWRTKRSSYVYHLGEVMNIQASFLMAEHPPFRLLMDSCMVTLEPNAASVPRYVFVQNHGSVGIWDSSAMKTRQ